MADPITGAAAARTEPAGEGVEAATPDPALDAALHALDSLLNTACYFGAGPTATEDHREWRERRDAVTADRAYAERCVRALAAEKEQWADEALAGWTAARAEQQRAITGESVFSARSEPAGEELTDAHLAAIEALAQSRGGLVTTRECKLADHCLALLSHVRAQAERVAALEQEREAFRADAEKWRAVRTPNGNEAAQREFAPFTKILGKLCDVRRERDMLAEQLLAARAAAERSEGDAERWRKLMGCERVRVLGHARLGTPDAHIGLELWGEHPACEAFPDEWYHRQMQARGEFTAFVDGLRATPAPEASRG